ncbi:MAG TPA: DUF29 domain-containing protein [Roseiarcus sp.]|jgi:hypothetical protein|nr:DUF29 domain-containing protein [Roseiarcus sp.]
MPLKSALSDRDFLAWSREQPEVLRAGKLDEADIERIADEIESLGRTEMGALIGPLRLLLLHLLKLRHQPGKRGASGEARIRVLRNRVNDHLADNPSLKSLLPEALAAAYRDAPLEAAAEIGLPRTTFPETCPWTIDEVLSERFWPR